MMLEHLGHPEAADDIVQAPSRRWFDETDIRTRDLGGKATCTEVGDVIVDLVRR